MLDVRALMHAIGDEYVLVVKHHPFVKHPMPVPDDSDEDGQLLRVYQQYFMVSNAAQLIVKEAVERGHEQSYRRRRPTERADACGLTLNS